MHFFKDQFVENFGKEDEEEDYSMDSASESIKETDEDILAGESQNLDKDEDISIAEKDYRELAKFYHSANEDKRRRAKGKP